MKKEAIPVLIVTVMAVWGCEENGRSDGLFGTKNPLSGDWSIPVSEVRDGGPGKDGIPALTDPEMVGIDDISYIDDNDLVMGYEIHGEARAYPHAVLDWHEIVNDQVGDILIAVTYCPLTGTGIGWDREINGNVTTFGVSGLLYNSNLIPYDRRTDSNWSQIGLECVNGPLMGTRAVTHALVETTWGTWKEMYPETLVLSKNTGYSRSYGFYPYGNYRTDHNYLIFPVSNMDNRLPNKERVHGIVMNGSARIYTFGNFSERVTVVEEEFEGQPFVIVGNETDNFIVSYLRDPGDGTILTFCGIQGKYPVVMTDEEGSEWDVFGRAVSGPRQGAQLKQASSFIGYWFSFAAFYPHLSIYGE